MKTRTEYTYHEMRELLRMMSRLFTSVRLVNPQECREVYLPGDGKVEYGENCYNVWDSIQRCANCVSYQAELSGQRFEKEELFDGANFHVESIPVQFIGADGLPVECVLEMITRTELTEHERAMHRGKISLTLDPNLDGAYLATHDALTRLYNREGFYMAVRQELEENPDVRWVMMAFNIHHFKLVTDLFGQEKSNEILVSIADLIRAQSRNHDICGHIEADRFAVCVPREHYKESILQNIVDAAEQEFSDYLFNHHVHVGVYFIDDTRQPVSVMYGRANLAIQSIEEDTERHISYFTEEMMFDILNEQQIIKDIERALESEDEIDIALQPQMRPDGVPVGAEALVRWVRPDGVIMMPGEFVGILEKSDLIARLDAMVWRRVVRRLQTWKAWGGRIEYISVNISGKDFYYMDVYKTLTELVEEYEIDPSQLHLELTETALIHNVDEYIGVLRALVDDGFSLSIDDFGKGYSSLSMLKNVPADTLKIDKEFLNEAEHEQKGKTILNTVMQLAHDLDMKVIMEGVETQNHLSLLEGMGCELFQGYYFSRPLMAEEFEERYIFQPRKRRTGSA